MDFAAGDITHARHMFFCCCFFFNFQYLFTYNSNKLNGGKTSIEAPRVSPQLGCQGVPVLDMLNAYNKYIIRCLGIDHIV